MSDLWLGALRTKMESVSLDRSESRWAPACAGATVGEVAARGLNKPEVEIETGTRERAPQAQIRSAENAR